MSINLILASFGGGLFGASLGVIGSFVMCGFVVLVGVIGTMTGNNDFLNVIAFGPYFGPHISFASAVAAAAYAGRKGLLDGSKDLLTALNKFKRADVLLVGGIFGVLSFFINELLVMSNIQMDTIALTVFISNMGARLIFGELGFSGFFGKSKNPKILPDISTLPYSLLLGLSVGLISSYGTLITNSAVIGYGIGAVTLVLLYQIEVPVTHHIAISAAYAFLATGSILIGGLFGVLAILLGETIVNLFNFDSDTYIDMPALVIFILSVVIFNFLS